MNRANVLLYFMLKMGTIHNVKLQFSILCMVLFGYLLRLDIYFNTEYIIYIYTPQW